MGVNRGGIRDRSRKGRGFGRHWVDQAERAGRGSDRGRPGDGRDGTWDCGRWEMGDGMGRLESEGWGRWARQARGGIR